MGRPRGGSAAPRPVGWCVRGARWQRASTYAPQACHWWAYVPWPRSAVGREFRTEPPFLPSRACRRRGQPTSPRVAHTSTATGQLAPLLRSPPTRPWQPLPAPNHEVHDLGEIVNSPVCRSLRTAPTPSRPPAAAYMSPAPVPPPQDSTSTGYLHLHTQIRA